MASPSLAGGLGGAPCIGVCPTLRSSTTLEVSTYSPFGFRTALLTFAIIFLGPGVASSRIC